MDGRDINSEQLISLVEERPVLWDKSLEDHKNRSMTTSSWRDVCSELHEDFEELDEKEKYEYSKLVVKKWTNMKDSWLKSQKKNMLQMASGLGMKICKKYLYDQEMSFLKKNLSHSQSGVEFSREGREKRSGSPKFRLKIKEIKSLDGNNELGNPLDLGNHEYQGNQKGIVITENLNENRHICFFKGIIPSLERFSEEQILEFQMGVLHVLQNVREGRPSIPTYSKNFPPQTPSSSTVEANVIFKEEDESEDSD